MTYVSKSSFVRRAVTAGLAALVLSVAAGAPSMASAQRRDRGEHRREARHDRGHGHGRGGANYRDRDRSRVVVRASPPRAYGPRVVYANPYYAPPPVRRVATRPAPPRPDTVWVEGYWQWTGDQYVWSPGYWEVIRPRHRFVQAHWEQRGRTWVLVPAMWVSVR